jgi:hypothetical protein
LAAAAGLLAAAAGLDENRLLKKPQIEASKPLFSFMIVPLLQFLTPSAQHVMRLVQRVNYYFSFYVASQNSDHDETGINPFCVATSD